MVSKNIILFKAVEEKPLITFLGAISILFITPVIQSINTPLAFDIWFIDLYQKPLNSTLYVTFSILFGIFLATYLYSRNKCIDCDKSKSGKSGFLGSVVGIMFGICPACFSFIGFLIPLGTGIFLTTLSPILTSLSIVILIYSLFKLGGFVTAAGNDLVRESKNKKDQKLRSKF